MFPPSPLPHLCVKVFIPDTLGSDFVFTDLYLRLLLAFNAGVPESCFVKCDAFPWGV